MASTKERVVKIIDITVLIVAASICAVNACLGVFKVTTADYAVMSFALLFAIALHFIFTNFMEMGLLKNQEELSKKIDSSTTRVINSLKGVEVDLFDNIEKVDAYVAERISKATKCVYDLNWQDYLKANPNPRNVVDREHTENSIDKSIKTFCSAKNSKVYQEIFTFSHPKNFDKMLKHMSYGEKYSCSYFDNLQIPVFPKMQFVIIDDEEVIFVSSAYRPNFCAIKDRRIVSIFIEYFNQAWTLSQNIKTKNTVDHVLIERIKTDYNIPLS